MEEDNFKIENIVYILKERWQLITIITLLMVITSAIFSFFIIKPKYEASTKLFIGKQESSDKSSNYSNNDVQMYQKLLKTYADVILTPDLLDNAFKKNNIDVNANSVLSNLTVTPKTDTQILVISYISGDKNECKDVVEAVSHEFVDVSKELIVNSNVNVIQKATVPMTPVSPNKKMNIIVAFILGLMVGSAVALILDILDNTFKDKSNVEKVLKLPVLGSIPNSDIIK